MKKILVQLLARVARAPRALQFEGYGDEDIEMELSPPPDSAVSSLQTADAAADSSPRPTAARVDA